MPTVTVRPNAVHFLNTATVVGAANAYAATSDDSDSSYVRAVNTAFSMTLPPPALPAGGRWKSATPRMRVDGSVATQPVTLQCHVYWSGGVANNSTLLYIGTSFAAFTGSTLTIAAGVAPTLAYLSVNSFTPATTDVSELYLDYLYATQPVCTVIAPSGTILVSQPTLQWAHTPGTDGGAQSQAQVRVFNSAQYSAGGFNPGSSTAFWQQNITGSAASTTPTVQLVDDDYRVYVRTAQSITGSAHWSDWAYSAFTVDSDPPPAPTVTADPIDAEARVRLVVTIDDTESSVIQVQRSVDSGASWSMVRGGTRINVVGSTWVGYDEETAGPDRSTVYRAQAIRPGVNGDVASDWSATAAATWTTVSVWLKDPARPSRNRTVDVEIPVAPITRPARATEHDVLGRAKPVAVSDVRGSARGSITVQTATDDDLAALLALVNDADILLLQTPASYAIGSVYVTVGDLVETSYATAAPGPLRSWSLPYTVVDEPADAGIEPRGGLTIDDLGELYEYPSDIPADLTFNDYV